MITRHGLDDKFVHHEPPLCIPREVARDMTRWTDIVRTSHSIYYVTCPTCKYYYFRPEERGNG